MSLHYQIPDDTDFSDDVYDNMEDHNQNNERPVRVKKHIINKVKKESPRNSRDGNFHRKLTPSQKRNTRRTLG